MIVRKTCLVFLAACLAVFFMQPVAVAEEGKVKIGVGVDYSHYNFIHHTGYRAGTKYGFLAGYEKVFASDYWFSLDAKWYRGTQHGYSRMRNSFDNNVRANALIGRVFETDIVDITPFTGIGFNHYTTNPLGTSYQDTNDFVLPLGAKFEKDIEAGLIGTDVRLEWVIYRERTGGKHASSSDWFDGSYNMELGVFFESNDIPVGVRSPLVQV